MKYILPIVASLSLVLPASAAQFTSAVVSKKINKVTVFDIQKTPHSAKLKETLSTRNSILTGRRSRAELTFSDSSIARLGANTAFSFKPSKRRLELQYGTMLLQVPKNAGGATIHTSSVSAAITGTTILFEYNKGKWIKLISLEGKVSLRTSKAGKITIKPGQMLFLKEDGSLLTKPVDVDLKRILETSQLLNHKLFGRLPKGVMEKIVKEVEKQQKLLRKGTLVRQNIHKDPTVVQVHRDTQRRHRHPSGNVSPVEMPPTPTLPKVPYQPPPPMEPYY